ncbi:unnamed protein product [marine sediment metagenome]|uniref:Tyr recombinase domain-containing protein n=1 Tax=marine sediment metagenome TaxID=412755 RepID=X1LBD6_9ZZZZ
MKQRFKKETKKKGKRIKVKIPKVLNDEQVEKLLSSIKPTSFTKIRNRAIISTFLFSGLRAGELINLKVSDVDIKEGWIRIREGKTGQRDIPIPLKLEPYLTAWDTKRPKHSKFYFTSYKGKKLFTSYIRLMVKEYGKKAGLDTDLHPHLLRHTYATQMLAREDINIDNLKSLLGHKAISSTEVYLHTLPKDLHKKIRGKKDIEQKQKDLNNLYKQFLTTQKDLASQVKEMLNKALKEE